MNKICSRNNKILISNLLLSILVFTLILPEHYSSKVIIIFSFWSIYIGVSEKFNFSTLVPKNSIQKVIIYSYLVFLFFNIISLLYSENYKEGIKILVLRLPLFILPLSVFVVLKYFNLKTIGIAFISSILLYCIYLNINVFYNIYLLKEPFYFFWSKYLGTKYVEIVEKAIHAPYLALFILGSLILSKFLIQNNSIKFIIYIILLQSLYLLSSKMSFLILVILVFLNIFIFLYGHYSKKIFVLIILFFTIGNGLFITNGEKIFYSIMVNYEIKNTDNIIMKLHWLFLGKDPIRRENWESSKNSFKNNWIFGTGIGDVIDELQLQRNPNTWAYQYKANAHNQYLEEYVRLGIVGGSAFLITLLGIITFAIKERKKMLLSFSLLISLVLISESMLARNKGVVFISIFMSLLFLNALKNTKKKIS